MAAKDSTKAQAWALFDLIVDAAAPLGQYSNPWFLNSRGTPQYEPDFGVLRQLLGVPLHLGAETQTGVPALALDVWLAYELRRAGFDPDAVWPRATAPRVLPAPVIRLLNHLPKKEAESVRARIQSGGSLAGVASASANILGKNYLKQVDVVMSDWATGPELLVSTKRMDSSFGKNAANRVEESYGDAKNLRLRHPLAALGFLYGLRSTIFDVEPDKAAWLIDLLGKLGREDDAYHAVCLLIIEYGGDQTELAGDEVNEAEDRLAGAGLDSDLGTDQPIAFEPELQIGELPALPQVEIVTSRAPAALQPGRFLETLIGRVLDATPVNMHQEARARRSASMIHQVSSPDQGEQS